MPNPYDLGEMHDYRIRRASQGVSINDEELARVRESNRVTLDLLRAAEAKIAALIEAGDALLAYACYFDEKAGGYAQAWQEAKT